MVKAANTSMAVKLLVKTFVSADDRINAQFTVNSQSNL